MYNRKLSKEKLQPAFNIPKETSLVQVIPITSEETLVQSAFIEQPSNQVVLNIPRRLTESIPATFTTKSNPKLRAQRLVTTSHDGSMTTQEQVIATSAKSCRCPSCKRPFLIKASICYCPKWGFTHPLHG